jgi:hypothetical protein
LNVPIWLVEYDCRDLAAATAYARAGESLPDLLHLERNLDEILLFQLLNGQRGPLG